MEVGVAQQHLRRWRAVQTRDGEKATNEREQQRRREIKRTRESNKDEGKAREQERD
jgi:hypothetical protein